MPTRFRLPLGCLGAAFLLAAAPRPASAVECDSIISPETPPVFALEWGTLTSESERMGRHLHVVDGLLLATARVHGLTLVSRNVSDFDLRGVPVRNPYG